MVKNKSDVKLYPFLTLNDNTKIIHSEVLEKNGGEQVEVRIKKAVNGKMLSASCWLPDYRWENIVGFSEVEIKYFQGYLETIAHIIMQLAREGGFEGSVDSALNKSQEIRIRKIEDFARKRVEKGVTLM